MKTSRSDFRRVLPRTLFRANPLRVPEKTVAFFRESRPHLPARAKLAHLGLIEHFTWKNSRYTGQQGWKLSSRMSSALRRMADKVGAWRVDDRPERREKDKRLVGLLQ